MAQTLEDWVNSHVRKMDNLPPESIYYRAFFRDSCRPTFNNQRNFYSPADGIILYQERVKPQDKIIEVKGQKYTLDDVMMDDQYAEETDEFMVVDIFMTLYDVHVNRMPYKGRLSFEQLPPIESNNMPMIFMEKDIFKGKLDFTNSNYDYLFNNARMKNTIYSPQLDLTYYVIQIADDDVNVIMPFNIQQKHFYNQNDRFSFVRWGSQCTLVIPVVPGIEMEFTQKPLMHVQAGVDSLVKITNYDDIMLYPDEDDEGDLEELAKEVLSKEKLSDEEVATAIGDIAKHYSTFND